MTVEFDESHSSIVDEKIGFWGINLGPDVGSVIPTALMLKAKGRALTRPAFLLRL